MLEETDQRSQGTLAEVWLSGLSLGLQTGPESLPLGVINPGAYVAGLGLSRLKA